MLTHTVCVFKLLTELYFEWAYLCVCICVFLRGMTNPLTDCLNFSEPMCVCVRAHAMRQIADIYRGAKLISVNCGQVHLHTFLISLDWYQPLSPRKASTGMSS